MSDEKLRWGILGTGAIAHAFAEGLKTSRTGRLVAVASRTREGAERFGAEFDVPNRHGGYDDLLADGEVDAVYISTPHPMHAQWAVRAAEAGKHILCEKPLGLNHAQAMAIVEAAREHDVFLMEAFMYRCHPQIARLVEILRAGTIGEIRLVDAVFSFSVSVPPEHRLLNPELGGGGILDVGCYCTSMARLVAGAAAGTDFAEPLEVSGSAHIGPTGVDEWAVGSLKFRSGMLAQLSCGTRLGRENGVRIYGSEGWIVVPSPWIPAREGGTVRFTVHRHGESGAETIEVTDERGLYGIEADVVAASIERRQAAPPAPSWEDTLGNMATLDRWRAAVGLRYPMERIEADIPPIHGRPLRRRGDVKMQYGSIPGIDKPISRLVMGVDNQQELPHAAVMFDDFFERGGTCFDTAHIYGGGICERLLGRWIAMRGVREDVVVLDKGAHTPNCTPAGLLREFEESLDRLQLDFVDLYLLHRDNPEVPVGEFVDALNRLRDRGRVRAFGGSNWTIERLEEAQAYARKHGLTGFSALSNNFSLARMINPVWPGCIAASTDEWRAWLEKTQMPLFAWSSQARGFFAGRAHPEDRSDPGLVHCWYSDDNFRRLDRARELAEKKGVLPIHIALAYVLHQPFPTFALIGPRRLSETRSSFAALEIDLTPEEVAWLDLRDREAESAS